MAKTFTVKLIKGLRGCPQTQRETVRCLRLTRINSTSEIVDNPANRGQILKIQHLVEVSIKK